MAGQPEYKSLESEAADKSVRREDGQGEDVICKRCAKLLQNCMSILRKGLGE